MCRMQKYNIPSAELPVGMELAAWKEDFHPKRYFSAKKRLNINIYIRNQKIKK